MSYSSVLREGVELVPMVSLDTWLGSVQMATQGGIFSVGFMVLKLIAAIYENHLQDIVQNTGH